MIGTGRFRTRFKSSRASFITQMFTLNFRKDRNIENRKEMVGFKKNVFKVK